MHFSFHRGVNTIFMELKRKYYHIKIDELKMLLKNCNLCSKRTVETSAVQISPIIVK